ncbi:MAG: hypothetical protein LBO04_03660 [Spirochaetaceae bacterium]|jgi:hypothetical protein|nr:hypothetical protein [Spirochaetaceae bacterium]
MGEDNSFEDLAAVMPELWREKAKELGAFQRTKSAASRSGEPSTWNAVYVIA